MTPAAYELVRRVLCLIGGFVLIIPALGSTLLPQSWDPAALAGGLFLLSWAAWRGR